MIADGVIDFLVECEGIRLKAYICPAGVPTIGIGNTYYQNYKKVKLGDTITKEEAYDLCKWYCETQIRLPLGNWNIKRQKALYSLLYRIGQGAFDKSRCKKAIEVGDWKTAYKNWDWIYANGKVLNGLVNRCNKEKKLFFEGLL